MKNSTRNILMIIKVSDQFLEGARPEKVFIPNKLNKISAREFSIPYWLPLKRCDLARKSRC